MPMHTIVALLSHPVLSLPSLLPSLVLLLVLLLMVLVVLVVLVLLIVPIVPSRISCAWVQIQY